jgi:16S rRNA (cytidine1402-2'-O)-methyltransferase
MTKAVLYVVATPIGNLSDMVPRAIEVLQSVALIAAEDTRHSSRLLAHFNIETKAIAYHDHSDQQQAEGLLKRLLAGDSIALISDAGTPLISDPGYRLVRLVRQHGISVVPVPGACALIAGLSVSGLPSDRFAFEGFLPAKQGQRSNRLQRLQNEERTMIFYEAPHRILECLNDVVNIFGADREVVIARELTKTFETIYSGNAKEVHDFVEQDTNQRRGEIVLMIGGAEVAPQEIDSESARIMAILLKDLSVKQASQLASEITGVKKKTLYQWALDNK